MEGSHSSSPPSLFLNHHGFSSGPDRLFGNRISPPPRTSRMDMNVAAPMPMPNAPKEALAPPPLPPPRFVPDLVPWEHADLNQQPHENRPSRPVSPFSRPWPDRKGSRAGEGLPRMQTASRRRSSVSTWRSDPSKDSIEQDRDEGYGSLSGTSIAQSVPPLLSLLARIARAHSAVRIGR